MTSFQVVKHVRRWTQCKKVGHTGTLDPMATGVLIICTGKATKRVASMMELKKTYEGTIELGKTTDTDDAEGHLLSVKQIPDFTRTEIEAAIERYCGEINQVPPQFSALKRNGKRAYQLARRGIHTDLEPRRIMIYQMSLLAWTPPLIRIRVQCGKGTYIRSLARDIGNDLGTGGYLTALRRTCIGSYHVDQAWHLDQFKSMILDDAILS